MKWRGFSFSFFTETPDSRREKCCADSNLILFLFFPFYSSNRQLLSLFPSLSNQWPQSSTFCLVLPAAASELPTCVDLFIYLSQNFLVFWISFFLFFSSSLTLLQSERREHRHLLTASKISRKWPAPYSPSSYWGRRYIVWEKVSIWNSSSNVTRRSRWTWPQPKPPLSLDPSLISFFSTICLSRSLLFLLLFLYFYLSD
jgi:hypothetical protein